MSLWEFKKLKTNSSFKYFNFHINIDSDIGIFVSLTILGNTYTVRNKIKQYITHYTSIVCDHNEEESIPNDVMELVLEREQVRKIKHWARADEIRDQLLIMGYKVLDTEFGSEVIKLEK